MYDITIDEFPPDRLAAIVHWRNDPAVNCYLRQGIRTLEEVQEPPPFSFGRCLSYALSLPSALSGKLTFFRYLEIQGPLPSPWADWVFPIMAVYRKLEKGHFGYVSKSHKLTNSVKMRL